MFNLCIDIPKRLSYYPQNITFQFYVSGIDRPQSVGSRTLFYPISIMPQILIEDSDNLKHPKGVKSISNTAVSHLTVVV